MLCYDNGKSAVRVVQGARPRSVHSWILPDPKKMPSKTALVDPRALDLNRMRRCSDPCILHFVVCGLPWLKAKYEMLGAFEDAWFGGKLPIAPSFHLDARDAFLASKEHRMKQAGERLEVSKLSARGNSERIEMLWRNQVIFRDAAARERQLEEGVLLRFERPQRILLGEKKEAMGKIAGEGAVTLARDAKTSAIAPLHVKDESAQVFAMVAALKAIGGMESSGKPVPPANPTSTAAVPPPPPQFTYDKAWILSNAVQNFL